MVALTGVSGSGKSTLLSIAGLLLVPTQGSVVLGGIDAAALGRKERADLRAKVGYLFQQPHLIRYLTVLENVVVPLLADRSRAGTRSAMRLLETVGLSGHATSLPGTLSGGQAQRVALCRALVREPIVILADEPATGLDGDAADGIRMLLRRAAERGVGVVVATHDPTTMRECDRVLVLEGGRLDVVRAAVP
jgi:ABC-type lipoprotein export system ATPase subunit